MWARRSTVHVCTVVRQYMYVDRDTERWGGVGWGGGGETQDNEMRSFLSFFFFFVSCCVVFCLVSCLARTVVSCLVSCLVASCLTLPCLALSYERPR